MYPISSGSSSSSECNQVGDDGAAEEAAVAFDGGAGVCDWWGMDELAFAGVPEGGVGAEALPGGGSEGAC